MRPFGTVGYCLDHDNGINIMCRVCSHTVCLSQEEAKDRFERYANCSDLAFRKAFRCQVCKQRSPGGVRIDLASPSIDISSNLRHILGYAGSGH